MKKSLGMSLVELMVVVGIMAIMAAFAAPSFVDSIRNNRLTSQTNNVLTGLKMARAEAIRRNRRVVFCRSDNAAATTPTCATGTGAWGGWLIFADANNNFTYTANEDVIRAETLDSVKISLKSYAALPSNIVAFYGDGFPRDNAGNRLAPTNAANLLAVMQLCIASSANNNATDISIRAGGKWLAGPASTTNPTCAAP